MQRKNMMGSGIGLVVGLVVSAQAGAAVTFNAWANVNRFYRQDSIGSSYLGTTARAVIRPATTSSSFSGQWQVAAPPGSLAYASSGVDGRQTFTNAMMSDNAGAAYVGAWTAQGNLSGTGAGSYAFDWSYSLAVQPLDVILLNSTSTALLTSLATTGGSGMVELGVLGNVAGSTSWALQKSNGSGGFTVLSAGTLSSNSFMLNAALLVPGTEYAMTFSKFGDSSQSSVWHANNGARINAFTGTTNITVFNFPTPVPAPGALALLGLSGLVAGRRRR